MWKRERGQDSEEVRKRSESRQVNEGSGGSRTQLEVSLTHRYTLSLFSLSCSLKDINRLSLSLFSLSCSLKDINRLSHLFLSLAFGGDNK